MDSKKLVEMLRYLEDLRAQDLPEERDPLDPGPALIHFHSFDVNSILIIRQGRVVLESYVFPDSGRLLEKYGEILPPGHVLTEEGGNSQTAYFLYAGRCAVYKQTEQGPRRLSGLEEGQLFGEMANLLGEKRTASVVAETEITVLALPPAILEELMRHSAPLSRRIIGTLCQRLERMNLAGQG